METRDAFLEEDHSNVCHHPLHANHRHLTLQSSRERDKRGDYPEKFTSKCSFLDNEFPEARKQYAGKRITRGLFRSSHGHLINADVNAAYNILKKSDPKALPQCKVNGVGGYVMYPLRVSIEHLLCAIS